VPDAGAQSRLALFHGMQQAVRVSAVLLGEEFGKLAKEPGLVGGLQGQAHVVGRDEIAQQHGIRAAGSAET
jgi:hypothetical protein